MIKEIRYNGFTETPSDYECPDGDLATVVGLVPEEGALQPILPPTTLFTLPSAYTIAFVHQNTGYKHYIVRISNSLYWIDEPAAQTVLTSSDFTSTNLLKSFTNDGIYEVNAIGNTLLVLAPDGMHYFLWKDSAYTYLGTHIPELPISFGLQGRRVESTEAFDVTFNQSVQWSDSIRSAFSDEMKSVITSQVLAKVNKLIADYYTNGNEFVYPFFVRYAYRLYDGSLVMHSAPILMVCATGQMPYVLGGTITQTDAGFDGTWDSQKVSGCKVYCALFKLDMAVPAQSYITALQNWSDIVTSVDIFVSEPLYSYDQSGECTGIEQLDFGSADYCICKATHGGTGFSNRYQYHQMAAFMWYGKASLPGYSIKLPMKGAQAQNENAKSCSTFYFLKSLSLAELSTTRKLVDIESGYFKSLYNREQMTDDYDTHSTLMPSYSFVYNSRLNIAGIQKKPFQGYHAAAQFCYTNGFVQYLNGKIAQGPDYQYDSYTDSIQVYIYLKKDGKTHIVAGESFNFGLYNKLPYIYYPDASAYKAVVLRYNPISRQEWGYNYEKYFEVELTPHTMLNGAVFFNNWEEPTRYVNANLMWNSSVNTGTVSLPNKIYTSEVNNPFFFPLLGINTVGTGTILGICSAVKALSQGQFGQFPLYAFTDEGVWALELADNGTFKARQPITRDVCINSKSITQIDSAVLFATDRGIMLISGSNSQCISDTLNSDAPFTPLTALPSLSSVISDFATEGNVTIVPFTQFLQNCRMLYDYTHQRIIVYNPAKTYAYVYSLKSKQWGMMPSAIQQDINAYPNALALVTASVLTNAVADFSKENNTPPSGSTAVSVNGLVITRPLKLDMPDVLKTVDTIIQRGYFQKGHVKSILYGSRNLFNWHLIYSSTDHYLRGFRGTPYKYFRIALLCTLEEKESVYGCTIQFTPRLTDQPR